MSERKVHDYGDYKIRMIPVGDGEFVAEVYGTEDYSHKKYHAGN